MRNLAIVCTVGVFAATSQASVLVATAINQTNGIDTLYSVDQTTGAAIAGPSTGLTGISSLTTEWSAGGATLWAGVRSSQNTALYYHVDPTSGATSLISGSSSLALQLACDPLTGRFVAANPGGFLFNVDPQTGATTQIGNGRSIQGYNCICFDQQGVLWAQEGFTTNMMRIDLTTGMPTVVGIGPAAILGMAVRPEDGQMFAVTPGPGLPTTYMVDPLTWTFTPVGTWAQPVVSIHGLAFVPSPSTLSAAAMVLGAAIRRRRR